MGINYLAASVSSTVLSLVGLQWWVGYSLDKIKSDGSIGEDVMHSGDITLTLQLILSSYITVALIGNFAVNSFILIILCLKSIFFVRLYPSEIRKVVERVINYIIHKGMFLPLVVPPMLSQAALWSTWLAVLCALKTFQALARDRLERLNASPSSTSWTYFRVFSVLLLVLSTDLFWMYLCTMIYKTLSSSVYLLLFFEPLSIAFEAVQAILVHGFQFLDILHCHTTDQETGCHGSQSFDRSAAGFLWEWKGILIRNLGFLLDMLTLLMAVAHYLYIWWLHGMTFHLVDAVLFLNLRALVTAMIKRVKGFIRLRMALSTLHGALPDATSEEIRAYDDECAICREPMAKAKRLSCNHLFHLACLRSWLDQGLNEVYSCPTCRRPLFMSESAESVHSRQLSDEQLARSISLGMDHEATLTTPHPNVSRNNLWRGAGVDTAWGHSLPSTQSDGAGPSTTMRTVGFGGVQMMMRHIASVGETYAHTAVEDTSWGLWPMVHPFSASGSSTSPNASMRYTTDTGGLRFRTSLTPQGSNPVGILSMVGTVREILPHIPNEIILQDLQRTNSVAVTVNNLLQM